MTGLLGVTVAYKLTEADAGRVNHNRAMARRYGWAGNVTGQLVHQGNQVSPGEVFPAIVVRVWPSGYEANLQVMLDGTDALWVTSVQEGDGSVNGQWFDLELVEELDPIKDDDDASTAPDELPPAEPTPQPAAVQDSVPVAAAAGRPMTDAEVLQAGGELEEQA